MHVSKPSVNPLSLDSSQINPNGSVFHQILRPVILLGQIFGLLAWDMSQFALKITWYKNGKHAMSILYMLIIKIGTGFILFMRMKNILSTKGIKVWREILFQAAFVLPVLFQCLVMIFCLLAANRFCNFLQLLKMTKKQFRRNISTRTFFLKHVLLQFVAYLVTLAIMLVYALDNNDTNSTQVISVFSVIILNSYELFLSIFFIVTVTMCAECFSSLNVELVEVLTKHVTSFNDFLDDVRDQYRKLYQLAGAAQDVFSILITAHLGYMAFTVCLASYRILNAESFNIMLFGSLVYLIVTVYRIFTIAGAADNLTTKKITILTNNLYQNPVEITAAGNMFKINMGTFVTIMSTIATYLIIILQFDASLPGTKEVTNLNATLANDTI